MVKFLSPSIYPLMWEVTTSLSRIADQVHPSAVYLWSGAYQRPNLFACKEPRRPVERWTNLYWVFSVQGLWALTIMKTCWNCDLMLGMNGSAPGSWNTMVTISLPMWRFLGSCCLYWRRLFSISLIIFKTKWPECLLRTSHIKLGLFRHLRLVNSEVLKNYYYKSITYSLQGSQ